MNSVLGKWEKGGSDQWLYVIIMQTRHSCTRELLSDKLPSKAQLQPTEPVTGLISLVPGLLRWEPGTEASHW